MDTDLTQRRKEAKTRGEAGKKMRGKKINPPMTRINTNFGATGSTMTPDSGCLSLLRTLQNNNDLRLAVCVSGHRGAGYYDIALAASFIELSR